MSLRITAIALISFANTVTSVRVLSEHCSTIKADFARRQLNEWNSDEAFTTGSIRCPDGVGNVPVLTVSEDGSSFQIDVPIGLQVASDDPETVHFVTHTYAEDQDGNVVYMHTLDPQAEGNVTTTTSTLPTGVTALTPYLFSNRDGLLVGETVSVEGTEDPDRIIACGAEETLQWVEGAWDSVIADLEKQQLETYGSDVPFEEEKSAKHTPYITFDESGTASVTVGSEEGEIHPMNGSADGVTEPHWITEIWIEDDQGHITTLKTLDPTGVEYASLEFVPEENAKQLTAYIWCNIHGLYVGPTVDVPVEGNGMEPPESSAFMTVVSISLFWAVAVVYFM